MTLFVGGQRHGTDVDMDSAPPATGTPDRPPSFVDPVTGEAYTRVTVSFQLNNPLTQEPIPGQVWENDIYLQNTLAGDPNQGMAGLQDSVTRWWFQTHGTRKESIEGSLAERNGHHQTGESLSARCEGCGQADVYATRLERAAWMQHHIETTGHTVRWSDDPAVPIIEGVNDGSQRAGDIQEG